MTAQTTDFSNLLYYNPAGPGFNAVEQVTITSPTSMDEGGSITVNLVTWGIPDGTVLAHTFPLTNISPLRFNISPISPVANNRASFFIAVNSDNTTASGAQSFDIQIRKTVTSNVLATKTITINDTSQSGGKVISLNPNYIAFQGGTSIPNEADSASTSATLSAPFTGTLAQNGTLNLTGLNSALILPAKNVKTIGMWIKLTGQLGGTRYLLDSREIGTGSGNGYIYSSGQDRWTLMSINGAPAGDSNWPTYWNTIVNNINTWQYVIVINQTTYTNSITLFNRHTLGESLANVQVGWVEAWDYVLNDTEINTAYLVHRTDYTITTPNALQITVGSVSQGGASPNNTVALSGVPGGQWTAIRNASSYVGKHGDNTTFSMTYISDDDSGTFIFGVGTESSFQADSFWYVP